MVLGLLNMQTGCLALGGPSPTITSPGSGDGEDLGLLGLIQQGLQNAQAIRQGGPQGKQVSDHHLAKLKSRIYDFTPAGGRSSCWPNPSTIHRLRSQ